MKNAEWLGWAGLLLIFGAIAIRIINRFSVHESFVWARTSKVIMMIGGGMVLVCLYVLLKGIFSTE